MCLYKIHRIPKISWKAKTVYKTLIIRKDGTYVTPYMLKDINIGDTIYAKECWLWHISSSIVEGEGVHAYVAPKKAQFEAISWITYKVCVVECEIPPFTPYWFGLHGDITATKIKIIKIFNNLKNE